MSDATYGTVTVGRLTLRETFDVKASVHAGHGERTVNIEGEESTPPLTEAAFQQRQEDLMTMRDMIIPIYFANKSEFDGLYRINDTGVDLTDYIQGVKKFSWSVKAERIGPANSAEIESRLTGITRQNDFGKTGTLWHAPAIGHYAYYTGDSRPGTVVSRSSEDGAVSVYYPIPADTSPRWSVTAPNYPKGRARIKIDGLERTGTNMKDGATWELSNGIVKATPAASGGINLGIWNGSAYETKVWNVSVGASATPIGDYQALSVIRNDFEMATIRLVKSMSPMGRSTLDLSIRRGARFVEGYLQTDVAATLAVGLGVAENGTAPASGGYVVATASDASGNKAIVGTARNFTAQTGRTGIQKNSAVSMDFWISAEKQYASAGGTNNDFETGSFSPWVATLNATTSMVTPGKNGTWAGRFTATAASLSHITHPTGGVFGSPGKTYEQKMWLRPSASIGAGGVDISFLWYNGITFISEIAVAAPALTAGVWTQVTVTATAPANTTNIGRKVAMLTPGAGAYLELDDTLINEETPSGDKAEGLRDQYIGSLAEMTMAVLR